MANRLIEGLSALDIEVVSPLNIAEQTSIVTCRVNGLDPVEIVQNLRKRNIIVQKRQDFVRFSPHLYNNEADIDQAVNGLGELGS